jgi:hypothetical protein
MRYRPIGAAEKEMAKLKDEFLSAEYYLLPAFLA